MENDYKSAANLFNGQLETKTCCTFCNTTIERSEVFTLLALNIEDKSSNTRKSVRKKKTVTNIEELLLNFSKEEELNMMNRYNCSKCGKLQNATRQITVAGAPKILTIQLKRFTQIQKGRRIKTVKLEDMIRFQEELLLNCKIANTSFQAQYNIKGIIVHKEETISSGHYIAYVREGTEWIEWNDQVGTYVTLETVLSQKAYILFFENLEDLTESKNITSITASKKGIRKTKPVQRTESEASKFKNFVTNRSGLINFGNTCYLNSVMQCLLRCEMLLRELKSPKWLSLESGFKRTVNNFFEIMSKPRRNVVFAPQKLFDEVCSWDECSHYKLGQQQNSAELLRVFLKKLHHEYKPASNLFHGEIQTTTYCRTCNSKITTDEVFAPLAINITEKLSRARDFLREKKTATSVEELLQRFSEEEELDMNRYDCTECGKLTNATRQMKFAVAPKILVIQLKRFQRFLKGRKMATVKLEEIISFQDKLLLDSTMGNLSQKTRYSLKGIIVHQGKTLSNGHYIAYVRDDNEWVELDDEVATYVTWKTVQRQQAYLLFFETVERNTRQKRTKLSKPVQSCSLRMNLKR